MRILLRRVLLVLVAMAVSGALGAAEPANSRWEEEIAAIEAREAVAPVAAGGILFTGSSSIRLWKTLAEDFPRRRVFNRGFGGSQLSDLVAYFDRLVAPGDPCQVVVYSGTNDINDGEAAAQVLADWAMLCGMIERELPGTRIALISVAPNPARWAQREEQERFNALAAEFCRRQGYDFIEVWTPMLGEYGTPSRDMQV